MVFRRSLKWAIPILLALAMTGGARAQLTSAQVIPGFQAQQGTFGCPAGNPVSCFVPFSSTDPLPVIGTTGPSGRTIVTLDVKTVTTGAIAVTALIAGHKTAGGWLQNPPSATINLCINEIGAATGTTSSGDTTCIAPGQAYNLIPSSGAVSVISSDSSHPFSGYGLQ